MLQFGIQIRDQRSILGQVLKSLTKKRQSHLPSFSYDNLLGKDKRKVVVRVRESQLSLLERYKIDEHLYYRDK